MHKLTHRFPSAVWLQVDLEALIAELVAEENALLVEWCQANAARVCRR